MHGDLADDPNLFAGSLLKRERLQVLIIRILFVYWIMVLVTAFAILLKNILRVLL